MTSYYDIESGERAVKLGAYTQAFEIFRAAVMGGEDPGFHYLCKMLLNDQLDEEQREEVKTMVELAVKDHNAIAAYNLAVLISRPAPGFDQDFDKAAQLFFLACKQKVPEAFLALARLYLYVIPNHPFASQKVVVGLLETAMYMGSAESAFLIGKVFSAKELTNKPDPKKAAIYFAVAGKLGHDEGHRSLVMLFNAYPFIDFSPSVDESLRVLTKVRNHQFEEAYKRLFEMTDPNRPR
jgi:TPR repeat protein